MAIKTQGTQLYFVRPGTLDVVNVGCITAIENVGAPIQPRDVTPVESEWESSEPGMFSLGQIDLEIRFDPATSGHTDVLQMYEGRVTANFAIGLGDGASPPQIDDDGEFVGVGGRSFLAFRGWIMDVPFSFPLNENLPAAVSIMQVPSLVPGVLGVGLLPAEAGIPCASDADYDGGEAFPSEVSVVLGSGVGWVAIEYLPATRPDKFEVWLGGQLVFDSGYVGDVTWQNDLNAALANRGLPPEVIRQRVGTGGSADWPDPAERERGYFYKGTADTVATVRVYAPLPGTAWVFRLGCPDPHEYVVITESGAWTPPEGVTRGDVLVVGAGGGGGARQGGGGGGGRVIFEQGVTFEPGEPIPVTVGDGGIGVVDSRGEKGGDTTFGDIVAEGGGYGGGRSDPLHRAGGDGGSGGGASSENPIFAPGGAASVGPGDGHDGGSTSSNAGGGGGGAGQPGQPGGGLNGPGGGGGNGADLSAYFGIDFNAVFGFTVGEHGWFGAGGGGSAATRQWPSGMGRGGFGGGGDGDGATTATPGKPAKPRTGGGGGGGAEFGGGGRGSDGVIVVRWLPLPPEPDQEDVLL